ncbi:conserved exported hypothetical protein [Pseudomonas sp. 8AS]|uniref:DUF2845 domain-containing protein n=1 Tax=Pseudomonas sp. 8AS TaxID=2653163 RepID=UPI0012F0C20E|nr:DUF2845 domain-containing protein [Pseudomonas sp. 8AS]VXB41897.1 conserved exported hypothetical protein [Pseudomonas sp. 8AS]
MLKLLATSLLLSLCCATAQAGSTLRCGSQLISTNDIASEVLSKCGEPVSRDFLGYREVVDYYGYTSEVPVEEWTYGPKNGMYYFLRLEGNRLVKIDSKRKN